ncbi:TraK family protein [Streptomyces chartreusis]|uniref:TraK family protein n=1 Tax=Streptomyces chartreusis TaxID=1969 RepID=UPI002E19BE57
MKSASDPAERLNRLPVQVRPRFGETADAYVRRLARANHLKPSYLHGFLTGTPNWFGRPQLERLAALADRSPEVLERVLTDARPPRRRRKTGPSRKPKRTAKTELYQRIRHDAEAEGLSMRALVRRHHVTWRTVRAALDSPEPQPRKPMTRRPSAIDPVKQLIDSLIKEGHTPKEIWASLMDEHDTSISYGTIRLYVHEHTAS